jgi:hypothetical protein
VRAHSSERYTPFNKSESAEEKEANAVRTFSERTQYAAKMLQEAGTLAGGANWLQADTSLRQAELVLGEFSGTSIERSPKWVELNQQAVRLRKRIQIPLDRLEALRTAESERRERASAAAEVEEKRGTEVRGDKPTDWSASSGVEYYLKKTLNDPDSLKMGDCTAATSEGTFWIVDCTYRARNGFGGMVGAARRFYIQQNLVVKSTPL